MIVVEGIYSMEGNICRLPEIVAIKKKYKAYLYVDEAHSIGALGKTGRGVCDYWGVDTADIDLLMGTFTKSFGSAGGYIAGSKVSCLPSFLLFILVFLMFSFFLIKDIIEVIRATSYSCLYDTSMSTICIQQIISSLKIIAGEDGSDDGQRRLNALRENSNFFRRRLKEVGFRVIGHMDSPIVPCMIFLPAQLPAFSRLCYERGVSSLSPLPQHFVFVTFSFLPLFPSSASF
jgi:serine palmitoyltransferase